MCHEYQHGSGPRRKELRVAGELETAFPKFDWVCNRQVSAPCVPEVTFYRPDLYCDMGEFVLVVEIDEHQHEGYALKCEVARLVRLCNMFARPVKVVRFNTDEYKRTNSATVQGCFTRTGVRAGEWQLRMGALKETITRMVAEHADRPLEVVLLFYGAALRE